MGLVALSVAGAVQHPVDPSEDVLGTEGVAEIAAAVADESQFGGGCNMLDETPSPDLARGRPCPRPSG